MKKNPVKFHSLVLLSIISALLFSTTSCSLHIEKRRYRKGYHVDLSYHAHKVQIPSTYIDPKLEQVTIDPSRIQSNKSTELKDSLVNEATMVHATKKPIITKNKSKPSLRNLTKKADHCDIITFTDGTQLEIVVEEISETEIKYKKCNFTDGPSYRIPKYKVKQIDMYNGQVYIPTVTKGVKSSNGEVNGNIISSLILGILAFILVIIGAVLAFSSGWVATAALAPAGILSLIGLIIGATTLRKGAHPLAYVAFFLNLFVQILAIIFTVLMFY